MKIGVIGLGYWGKKVAKEYRTLLEKGIIDELYIYDTIKESIAAFKEECPECQIAESFDALLSSDIEGFHICTPNSTHYDISMKLMENGKNILVEKPMAMTYREARKMALFAYNNNLILAVGHIFRFSNAVRKVKELYEKGEIGKLWYADLRWSSMMPSPRERDVIFDLAPHPIDILNYISSSWPVRVSATGKAFRRDRYEEVAYINMEFEDGMIARIEVSWIYPEKIRNVGLMGDKKFISAEAVKQEIRSFDVNEGKWSKVPVEGNKNTILDEVTHFIMAIENRTTPINDGFNASENIKVLEASVRSMREHQVIELDW